MRTKPTPVAPSDHRAHEALMSRDIDEANGGLAEPP